MAEKTLSVKLSLNDKQFQSALRKSTRSIQRFGKKMQGFGDTMTRNITLPVVGLGAAAVKMASDFEETQSKFNTVFKDISDNAQAASKELSDSFGLSSRASMQLLSDTGDLLTGFGFTQEEALKLSKEVNKLAVDLASFTNVQGGAEAASKALTKALLGERESIKQLGIAITEADLKSFAAEQGLVFKELGRVEKATLTYQLALQQSQNAVGDFARTSDSFANQLRILKAELEDVAVQLGVEILPLAKDLVSGLRDLAKFTNRFSSEQRTAALQVAGFAAVLGPIITVAYKMITAFAKLRLFFLGSLLPALINIGKALVALTPQGKIIAGVILAAQGIYTYWDDLVTVFDNVKSSVEGLLEKLKLLKKEEDIALDFSIQDQSGQVFSIEELRKRTAAFKGTKIVPGKKPVQMSQEESEGRARMAKGKADTASFQFAEAIKLSNVELEKIPETLESIADIEPEGLKSFNEAFFSFSEEFRNSLMNTFSEVTNIIGNVGALFNQMHQKQLTELEMVRETELANIEAMAISEEEKNERILESDKKFEKKKAELEKKRARRVKAVALMEAVVNVAAAVVKSLPNVPLAIATGALGAAQIATIASTPLPAFANGGIVSGPTLGLMGEYAGANTNPEVIAPLNKLKDMIGGQTVQVQGVISGEDIFLSNDRYSRRKNSY